MAYVVDLEDDYAESDIPTTLIRSKADCPSLEVSIFKSLRNQYLNLILTSKKHFYSNLVSSSSDNPKRLWQTVNKLLHHESSSPCTSGISVFVFLQCWQGKSIQDKYNLSGEICHGHRCY